MLEPSPLHCGSGSAPARGGLLHALPGRETEENACPEGGGGSRAAPPETAKKHWKSLQKRDRGVNGSLYGLLFGRPGPLRRALGAARAAPPPSGRCPWETLKNVGNTLCFATCAGGLMSAPTHGAEPTRDPAEVLGNMQNNKNLKE